MSDEISKNKGLKKGDVNSEGKRFGPIEGADEKVMGTFTKFGLMKKSTRSARRTKQSGAVAAMPIKTGLSALIRIPVTILGWVMIGLNLKSKTERNLALIVPRDTKTKTDIG